MDDVVARAQQTWDDALSRIPNAPDWIDAQARAAASAPGLSFHGRSVVRVARPRLMDERACAADQDVIDAVSVALDAAATRVLDDPDVRRACLGAEADEVLLDLYALPTGMRERVAFGRFDGVRATDGVHVMEFNGGLPGGVLETVAAAQLMRSWPPCAALEEQFDVTVPNLREAMVDALGHAWRSFGGDGDPRVAFVVPAELRHHVPYAASAVAALMAAITARGMSASSCDPGELTRRDGHLHGPDGRVDVAVRVFFDSMVPGLGERLSCLIDAVRAGEVCLLTPFRAGLLGNKSLFALATDPALDLGVGPEQRDLARAHLPWTRLWRAGVATDPHGAEVDLGEYALEMREHLVLKPANAYGGAGVLLGWECDEAAWRAGLAQAGSGVWIVQERLPLVTEEVPAMEAGFPRRTFQSDHNPLVFNDVIRGYFVRASEGRGMTNLTSGDGTVVPTFFVSPRA